MCLFIKKIYSKVLIFRKCFNFLLSWSKIMILHICDGKLLHLNSTKFLVSHMTIFNLVMGFPLSSVFVDILSQYFIQRINVWSDTDVFFFSFSFALDIFIYFSSTTMTMCPSIKPFNHLLLSWLSVKTFINGICVNDHIICNQVHYKLLLLG